MTKQDEKKNYHFKLYSRVIIGKNPHEFRVEAKVKTKNTSLVDATNKFLRKRIKIQLGNKEFSFKKLTDKAHFIQLDVYKR